MKNLALRDRLAVSFALALAIAYALIAVLAVIVVDRAVAGSIDGRLSTVAQAIFIIAGDERDEIDRKDRQQFSNIVTDATGALVTATDGTLLLGTSDTVPEWARRAMRNERVGQAFAVNDGTHALRAIVERRRSHHETNTIVVWQSMRIVADVERVIVVVLTGFALVVAAGGYAAGRQIAIRGLLPLTTITAVVADIAAHDLSRRLGPQKQSDELGRLAATFDQMLDRLESAFERQRKFTADASHDLRAPLATLRAEVELALRRERSNAEYRAALEEIAVDADHLDRLIDALLAAARADAGDLDLHALDLGAIALASVDAIASLARAKGVRIETAIAAGGRFLGDADLLERAILATLHNAVKYSPPGSSMEVDVVTTTAETRLRIRDRGPGFSDSALVRAFDRFWRDDDARGRSGSGLGLAIAHGIVQRCGGEIAIRNAADGGAEVTIRFPLVAQTPIGELQRR